MDWNQPEILPLSKFKEMRHTSPVHFLDQGEVWDLYRYEDVKEAFTNYAIFSSQGSENPKEPIDSSILRQDPPKHRQLRMLVSQAFTPRVIEGLAPKITSITHALLDEAEQARSIDALTSLASPLPITVIAEMLGVSIEDREQFRSWSDALVGTDHEAYLKAQQEMTDYFNTIIEERRREPQDDLITNLVQARVEGESLSEIELIGFCILLLVAGNETTTNLINSSLLCIDSLPDVREALLADRSLIPGTLEEVFRYCSPVQQMFREVKQDVELSGQVLRAGQFVRMWIGSANHDETIFDQPDQFHMHRSPNPHLGLGSGIHYCLGAQLARLESRIMLEAILERFPHFHRDREIPLERTDSQMMFALKRLPIHLY
ncbi:cytochrome P450 [Paenibacillus sp. 1001270B_150601_E10]|uniref:cytochrome P450 n=1 Tax=Paenibacillus sp. 1001270B_150601_E10 TaxID=2787079 RepID=UPI00189F659E|nr:cytochrome P450 [Paenibacillus sp. 1001270B_150601_E10]